MLRRLEGADAIGSASLSAHNIASWHLDLLIPGGETI